VAQLDFDADEGCFAYWMEPVTNLTSVRRAVDCPREIVAGETIRLAGRVCFRESSDEARREPVRCPYQLLKIQDALETGEGEWSLSPHDER